ncbi:glycosyltransferase [Candidatus Saccharibacteria bacterium]|nr:glycosyltransferase [Candidatus Saccharibacteria bacterium]
MSEATSSSDKLDLSVVIPFHNKAKLTMLAVDSLLKFGPRLREIILLSNNSSPDELEAIKLATVSRPFIKIFEYNHPFNYQKLMNFGVEQATGQFLLLLNNDTELRPESAGLIERMVAKAADPKVGIVGCTLLYGDGNTIQHGGVFLRPKGQAEHLYAGRRYSQSIAADRDVSIFPYDITTDLAMTAVTGAVQVVEKAKYVGVGGMDTRFIICGGDVDLCIRLNHTGMQTWFVGGGFLLHKESQSRAFIPIPYNDFYWSYRSYMQGFDIEVGDRYLPAITNQEDFR